MIWFHVTITGGRAEMYGLYYEYWFLPLKLRHSPISAGMGRGRSLSTMGASTCILESITLSALKTDIRVCTIQNTDSRKNFQVIVEQISVRDL